MVALLSTVQSLPAGEERDALERALVPVARDAALGALAPGLAHDASNALFGLVGLLGLLDEGAPLSAERIDLLRRSADDLEAVLRPALEFLRGTRDDRSTGDLAGAVRLAIVLYAHGDHPPVDARLPEAAVPVACPAALTGQAAVHLLLAASAAERIAIEVDGAELRVGPAGDPSLDELVARRIALDHGGGLDRDGTTLRLRLQPA